MLACASVLSSATPATDPPEVAWARLLAAHVTPGGVRYEAWRSNPLDVAALRSVIASLSAADPSRMRSQERTAWRINLYNAKIVEIVLEQRPERSIRQVWPGLTGYGVFLEPVLTLAGKKTSLRALEEALREDSRDPRIHFAINCASRSCPPIPPTPIRAASLDAQLDRASREFLALEGSLAVLGDEGGGRLRVSCSKIFDWYGKDFEYAGGAAAFIARHAPAPIGARIRAATSVVLDYQDYDWSLNEATSPSHR